MKIHAIWEGRTRDQHLRALQEDYAVRIGRFVPFKVEEVRISDRTRSTAGGKLTRFEERAAAKSQDGLLVLVDPRGQQQTSEQFAAWLGRQALAGTRELVFAVGGTEGFSEPFRRQAGVLLSLSMMTLTHDWARTLLLEQIYRGFTILRGHPYPR